MMKRLLTYGLLLLTILASHFVVSACQDDLPETTEVMLTFTTRADLSLEDDKEATDSDLQDVDRMKDLRVIMLDGDNKVVGNAIKADINKSSVVFKFSTPASHGEVFKFLAIANEESIGLGDELSKIVDNQDFSNYETEWKKRVISSTLNPTADNPLPQTKFWTWTYSVLGDVVEDLNPVLDYVGCKISVQFKNETTKPQSLNNIYIAGVGSGYLFKQDENDFVSDASANIYLSPIVDLPATETSEVQHCYTYPKGNISSPTLFATWNDVQYSLTLKDNQGNALTALNRNDYLQIVVTLTDVGLDISYVIAEWVNNQPTYIGQSPSIGDDGYDIPEWGDGTDVNIGGGDKPDTPVEPGGVIWYMDLNLTLTNGIKTHDDDLLESDLSNFIAGNKFGIVVECLDDVDWSGFRVMQRGNTWYDLPSAAAKYAASSSRFDVTEDCVIDFTLAQGDIDYILKNKGVDFWGNGVIITQIYIKAPETQ